MSNCLEKGAADDYIDLPDDILSADFDQQGVAYDLIDNDKLGNRAIVIHNVLTIEECNRIRELMDSRDREPTFQGEVVMTAANLKLSYRNNLRILAKNTSIASALLERCTPILTQIGENVKLCSSGNAEEYLHGGVGMRGLWTLNHLNPLFRLCKYNPMGHFGPHYDSDYIVDPCLLRSLKTFMIYLNDDYEGGQTSFVDCHDMYLDPDRGIYCSPPDKVFAQLKARTGDLLVFDHKILHEGMQVISGQKYIMRSDVMYARGEGGEEDSISAEAVRTYHAGIKLEEQGLVDDAIVKYRRAYKMCPELERYF